MPTRVRKIKAHAHREKSLQSILSDSTKRARFIFLFGGIALVALGFYYSRPVPAPEDKKEAAVVADADSFAGEPVKVDKELLKAVSSKNKLKSPPTRISIPSVGIDLPVKESPVVNGYWQVFPDSAGWGAGSSFPQDTGNQVIFAHARDGLFLPLKQVKAGQLVYVFTKDKWYLYKIDTIKEVLPTATEVIAPTEEAVLTLYTCSGFADSKRLIVQAKRVEN